MLLSCNPSGRFKGDREMLSLKAGSTFLGGQPVLIMMILVMMMTMMASLYSLYSQGWAQSVNVLMTWNSSYLIRW